MDCDIVAVCPYCHEEFNIVGVYLPEGATISELECTTCGFPIEMEWEHEDSAETPQAQSNDADQNPRLQNSK